MKTFIVTRYGIPVKCEICDDDLYCYWTDYSGEGSCINCGTSYMLIVYDEHGKIVDTEMYISVREDVVPHIRTYWDEYRKNMGLGSFFNPDRNPNIEGLTEFIDYLETNQFTFDDEDIYG